jgi:hypothetical protein
MNEAQDKRRARRLRPEERAAHYSELDEQQKQAFKKIIQLIAEAIGDLPTRDRAMDSDRQAGLPPCWLGRVPAALFYCMETEGWGRPPYLGRS